VVFHARGDGQEGTERIVDRLRIREGFEQLGVEQHHVGAAAISIRVLAADAAGEIVLLPHFGCGPLRRSLLRSCVFHVLCLFSSNSIDHNQQLSLTLHGFTTAVSYLEKTAPSGRGSDGAARVRKRCFDTLANL